MGEAEGAWVIASAGRSAASAVNRARTTFMRASSADGLLSGQEAIEARGDVLEIGGGVGAGRRRAQLGRHPPVVADLVEGLAHLDPVHVALAEVDPVELPVGPVELEVLQMHLRDARAE